MSDPEAMIQLVINGDEIIAHRWNSSVFSFIGELAAYNHVFVATETHDDGPVGHYLFNGSKGYREVLNFMLAEGFPQHLNLTEVAQCDSEAFESHEYQDIREMDTFPKEWT